MSSFCGTDYVSLFKAGKLDEAKAANDRLKPIREVYTKWVSKPFAENQIVAINNIKVWSEMLGMAAGPARPSLLNLTTEEKADLKADLTRVGLI